MYTDKVGGVNVLGVSLRAEMLKEGWENGTPLPAIMTNGHGGYSRSRRSRGVHGRRGNAVGRRGIGTGPRLGHTRLLWEGKVGTSLGGGGVGEGSVGKKRT